MDVEKVFSEESVKVNIVLNKKLEDNKLRASTEGLSEAESANIKMQKAFYGNEKDHNTFPPTYIYNNTPAIKVTGDEN
ncbi:hypothetical protein [Bacillus sp. CECT 9360]|uniref:hypothetical protein n=1 Tax=Bacillus sp. CECT 9360 TaxID=2845821 RepID=UPI001E5D7DAD|nr:hypothetical protein [Bacillus sp. CECT 9360]CAH0347472.1 hypothetical protein BCI9360_03872 [Bacillus sp. CECT 9360]